ncbi:phage integrase family protein [Burkholderia gladioli]|uniref:phage integrase family protein n=1 Tax=Burkholderia gladioli TaxID=28095 RepID=UPI00313318C8
MGAATLPRTGAQGLVRSPGRRAPGRRRHQNLRRTFDELLALIRRRHQRWYMAVPRLGATGAGADRHGRTVALRLAERVAGGAGDRRRAGPLGRHACRAARRIRAVGCLRNGLAARRATWASRPGFSGPPSMPIIRDYRHGV